MSAIVSDYLDENRTPAIAGVMISGAVVSLVVVSLRFWVRAIIVRKVGPDDWTVLAAFIFLLAAFSLLGTSCAYGLGKHAATLTPSNVMNAAKFVWVAFQFTPVAESTGKASIALMLMRVTTSKYWKYFFIALILLNIAVNIATTFSILMSCWPIEMLWNTSLSGHCNITQRNIILYIQGATVAATDLLLAISPILILWDVKISRKLKWLLCGLLAIGIFTCAAAFIRMNLTPQTYDVEDPTWGASGFVAWKCVEISLSIIVSCLPTLRPFFDGRATFKKSSQPYVDSDFIKHPGQGMRIYKANEVQIHWSERSEVEDSAIDRKEPAWTVTTVNEV